MWTDRYCRTVTQTLKSREAERLRGELEGLRAALIRGGVQGQGVISVGGGREQQSAISPAAAMWVCGVAGLAGSGWSPLSTYARRGGTDDGHDAQAAQAPEQQPMQDPVLCLLVFQLGQLCALPSIASISGRLAGTGVSGPLRALEWRQARWGILCGFCVASGYIACASCCRLCAWCCSAEHSSAPADFTASTHIPATVAFGIVACNPVLAMILDICRCDHFWLRNQTAKPADSLHRSTCLQQDSASEPLRRSIAGASSPAPLCASGSAC
jgi:hypothetical protein